MTDSEASVTGGSFTAQTKLYGGRAETETEKRSEASALRNKRTFTTGDTVTELYGGYAYARPTKTSISLQANENHLTLKAGANDYVAGGYARGTQMASGTLVPKSTAVTNENEVTIEAGSGTFQKDVYGGSNDLTLVKATDGITTANSNKLHINGGTFEGMLYGGSTNLMNDGGDASATASVNEVTLGAGTLIKQGVRGGYANTSTAAGEAASTASSNVVHLSGAAFPDDRTPRIYGGYADVGSTTGSISAKAEQNVIDGTLTGIKTELCAGRVSLAQGAATTNAVTGLVAENTITLTNGKAGTLMGGNVWLGEAHGAADLRASKNHVTLTDVAGDTNTKMYGAHIETQNVAGALKITAEENTVTAEGTALDANDMYGSHVLLQSSNAGTTEATVTASRVLMGGKSASYLAGGYADIVSFENAALTVKLTGNTAEVQSGTAYNAYGARADTNQKNGAAEVTAEGNTITVTKLTADGGSFVGARLFYERDSAATAPGETTLTAKSNKADLNEGKLSDLSGAEIRVNDAFGGAARYEAAENAVTGTGGTFANKLYGGWAELIAEKGAATAALTKNTIDLTNTKLDGTLVHAGKVEVNTNAAGKTASAAAEENVLRLKNVSGIADEIKGGYVDARAGLAGAAAAANSNSITVEGGTLTAAYDVYGGKSGAWGKNAPATASASKNTVALSAAAPWKEIYGGSAFARAEGAAAAATANENTLNLAHGTFTAELIGAYASADGGAAQATANANTVNISGGTYKESIYAGYANAGSDAGSVATIKDNRIVITGTLNLSAAQLYGHYAAGATKNIAGNALVVKETKGIKAKSIEGFQKLEF